MNAFEQLRLVQPAAAHQLFEEACAAIIRATTKKASRVRVFRGDGGVDAFAGHWGANGTLDVFQIKYFPENWGPSQKQQIRNSYGAAAGNARFSLRSWTLCVPTRLTQDDWHWWSEWSRKDATKKQLLDGDKLMDLLSLPQCAPVRQQLAAWGVVGVDAVGPRLIPEIYVYRPDDALVAGVLAVRLSNTGDRSADQVRVNIAHSDSRCVAHAPDHRWWSDVGGGVLNPRSLSANLVINPGETVPVLPIPFGSEAATPYRVRLSLTAADCLPFTGAAVVEARALAGDRIAFVEGRVGGWAVDNGPPQVPGEPSTVSARLMLRAILSHGVAAERGVTRIRLGSVPGHVCFRASLGESGPLRAMPPGDFEQAIAELLKLRWLSGPTNTGGHVTYPINPTAAHAKVN